MRSNAPSTDERLPELVFVDNGLEIIGVSLGVIIIGLEWLTTLTLTARVVTDLMKGNDALISEKPMNRIAGTNKVEVLEEFGVIKLFLKCKGGARETRDEDNGRFGRVASSMSPNFGTVLRLDELS